MTFPSLFRRRVLVVACTAAVLGTALSPVAAAAPAVSWGRCTGLPEPVRDLECGTLTVPLDYAEPGSGTIELALIRARATGGRAGSMVFNFGGGGHDVLDFAAQAPQYAALRTRYDLVSFDRRGSGGSAPPRCGTDRAADRFLALGPGVGRMVLDAGVNPDLSLRDVGTLLTRISQDSYDRFLAACVKAGCEPAAGPTIHYTGPAPILVITATNDTAAPPAGAARLARKLGDAVTLTYEGDNHGSYPIGGPCVTDRVEDYLLRNKIPAPGISCPKTG
ncbi:alpha/beta hydrolase [Nonomuraea endophytica]|uniref:Pimeloyl-ACP methyl ester carboxylesterase n=1 Tax=Nonomuraea endophytica TaxID=714136 RepID=A0A7W8ABK1_9ACTN|nr:alpha/beta hydrolase [Nonomuraea endophytica]MBB5081753.1 pimeloyl-ACP methyl ester carboxylesterase [Nonomuraea endophytica]